MEHTLALIGRAQQGDKEARDTLFKENTGLICAVAKRFLGRGADMEDLFQIGSIGLLKAADRFDLSYQVKFSTYAVPMIAGEIRRFLRDDGIVKVSRALKENYIRICRARECLEEKLNREPTVEELVPAVGLTAEEIAEAVGASEEVVSLQSSVYQGEGTDIFLEDRIPRKDDPQGRLLDRIFLAEILEKLSPEERKLIGMRYFQDMTQTQIAGIMKVSQVQVSRLERRILGKLRDFYEDRRPE